MRKLNSFGRSVGGALALTGVFGLVGCSAFETSHIIDNSPAVTVDAVAKPGDAVAQPFSLVAADSLGMAVFGQQVVLDDLRAREGRFADAN